MANFRIRAAQTTDAESACDVLRRSISECCTEDHQNDPGRLAGWLNNKTPENVSAWIAHEDNISRVAELDGRIVGFAMLHTSGHLALNYILVDVLYQGIGKALLQSLETAAEKLGVYQITLESTRTARDFYTSNGFESSGPPNTESPITGYPMRKQLSDAI